MKKHFKYILLLLCFGFGVYYWKITNTNRTVKRGLAGSSKSRYSQQKTIVSVGGTPITKDELQFEYKLLTVGVAESKKLTPVPDLGEKTEEEMQVLKDKIIRSLIERKLLYKLVESDKTFNLADPARFVKCVDTWMRAIKKPSKWLSEAANQERLKTKLCEQSILDQYMQERIIASLTVREQDALEYFKNHRSEFKRPQSILIRQIVLADDKQAKSIRAQVNSQNFAALARRHSITPEASKGGLLGPFPLGGDMPRFFEAAYSMRPGQISEILKSTYGFHIIMLEKNYAERELSYQEALPKIKSTLLQKEKERAYQKWIDRALHSIDVSPPKTPEV